MYRCPSFKRLLSGIAVFGALAAAGVSPAGAQTSPKPDVCITIDEARDTLSPQYRSTALVLISQEFERAGRIVVSTGCATPYVLSDVSFGRSFYVTLSGPEGIRQGTANGLADLPPLYSQMVRSIVSGKPMSGFNVIDRTNVTDAQSSFKRIQSESFGYARLGYGSILAGKSNGSSAFGFGYRVELDSFGLDVSFLNLQIKPSQGSMLDGATAGSAIKLEALHFMNPLKNGTAYFGGGLSYGGTERNSGQRHWSGSGLQGELTAGYEFARASTLRLFVQADATLPAYKARITTYSYSTVPAPPAESRYTPSVAFSIGFGWDKNHRGRP